MEGLLLFVSPVHSSADCRTRCLTDVAATSETEAAASFRGVVVKTGSSVDDLCVRAVTMHCTVNTSNPSCETILAPKEDEHVRDTESVLKSGTCIY